MKNQKLTFLIFLSFIILFTIPACNDDDIMIDTDGIDLNNDQLFAFECDYISSNPIFVTLTNQSGEVLFDTVSAAGETLQFFADFPVEDEDKIDLTYGFEFSTAFNLHTYRDIQSGYVLGTPSSYCENNMATFDGDLIFSSTGIGSDIEININGLHEYDDLQISFYSPLSEGITANSSNNSLKITGTINNQRTYFIAVLPKGQDQYKGTLIHFDDWNAQDGLLEKTLNFSDFESVNSHTINTENDASWIINTTYSLQADNPIEIARWNNYRDTQNGTSITIAIPNGITPAQVKLEIKDAYLYEGYNYLQILDALPSSIVNYDPAFSIEDAQANSFGISSLAPPDLAIVNYNYNNNNRISSWKIYQRKDCSLSYELPEVPTAFLEVAPIANVQLSQPTWMYVEFLDFETEDFSTLFEQKPIGSSIKCFPYKNKYLGHEF